MPTPFDRDYTERTSVVDAGVVAGDKRGRLSPKGLHHLALFTSDMRKTVEFYERVLGMRLRAVFEMHGVPGAKHCFLEGGNGFEISFVQSDGPPTQPAKIGKDIPRYLRTSLDGNVQMPGGTLAHIAFRCRDTDELKALHRQVKNAGVQITPIIDHGLCFSAYFVDPNGLQLELACTARPYLSDELRPELLDTKLRAGSETNTFRMKAAKL
eukprot:TRINITY_DN41826_c0_g1_i1.p2 TRINITY_DN41826_c0_g1~~TRINITY_DN41826_c0_g1_i1.p2  ORF type:complete len:211 (+),score=56.15 TRINITY_DN41826_c0_g1_i1:63-695(+)